MLAEDNATGAVRLKATLLAYSNATHMDTVIAFPGRDREKPLDLGLVKRAGFLDGELVRIGGKDKSVHLQLQDGDISHSGIVTDRATARQLAPLIFGPTVRLWGAGTWRRNEEAVWEVERFQVLRFEVLDEEENLLTALDEAASLGGSRLAP